jgi:3-hydroxymyristoyl/3-hydroxydecanoyl-(acyl carrier protein) dehydratase
MVFKYIDKITALEPMKFAKGVKALSRDEKFFYWLPDGRRGISPAVVAESLAQLGGWLIMASSDFKKRAVPVLDEFTEYPSYLEGPASIDLSVEMLSWDGDVVVTRGEAKVGDVCLLRSVQCRGFMLPIEEFCDPEQVQKEFKSIVRPEHNVPLELYQAVTSLRPNAGSTSIDNLRFLDAIIHHSYGEKVVSLKNIAACEEYFVEHFPRKPVVPGVMLSTFVGETCQYLIKKTLQDPLRATALVPTYTRQIRFRKFVEPGDQCLVTVERVSGDISQNDADIVTKVTIQANNNRVMQGEMGFKTMIHKGH